MSEENIRPDFDKEIQDIATYTLETSINSELAFETARYVLLDSLACALMALQYPNCTKLLGPIVPDASLMHGAHVPGTDYRLEPVRAAFNIGALIRWLDFNDTWLASEWGHPSDNLGGILATADYLARQTELEHKKPLLMREVLEMLIKAEEIQGVIALENSFNRVGLDHVILVKIASTAVVTKLLGGDFNKICDALSLAFVDGQSLRTYRHAPNTGPRKSWAAGDATSRAVNLSLMAMRGASGYPSALTAPTWGFYDVSFKGNPFKFNRNYGSYVIENILFKISFPAEFHAQTAVEAAIKLHPQVVNRLDEVESIKLQTQESAIRIIDKKGPLYNPADRDHCLQYMVAIGLLFGDLEAKHYEDDVASDPRIDALRDKMQVSENPRFTQEYLDPEKRSIGNSIQIVFKDGSASEEVSIDYPIGHRLRRAEGIPKLIDKYNRAVVSHFSKEKAAPLLELAKNLTAIDSMPVDEFMNMFTA